MSSGSRWTERGGRPDCSRFRKGEEQLIRIQQVSDPSPLVGSSQTGSMARPVHIDQLLDLWRTVGPCRYGDSGHGVGFLPEFWKLPRRIAGRQGNKRRSTMGDKGGRKDKEKGKKQKSSKQKKAAKDMEDKQPKRRP